MIQREHAMILIDNRNILRFKDRELLQRLTEIESNELSGNVIVETAKTGVPTLKKSIDGRLQYLHSKYDPVKDAERFISKFDVKAHKHVLFIGVGLGYQIEKFTEVYPDVKFSIYEPDEEVLVTYLANQKLDKLPIQNLVEIITGIDQIEIESKLVSLLEKAHGVLQIITLPVYEKLYGAQIQIIMERVLTTMKNKRDSLSINFSFQKRWTINAIKNFPKVLQTPNILHDIDKSKFKDKPAIIVAAGPSLNKEFENLRYIKENGLAYIFSVGSAINALIEHGIYPDAACTYDPTERNQFVFEKLVEKEIDKIPLIFGSSVGFETLENYPGIMLHMITNQDTIASRYLDNTQELEVVLDAPSIAVVTFQLLNKLGCSPIVLVGQNLGFQENKRYATGIEYEFVENQLNDKEIEEALITKDVYGNEIHTNDSFNRMRQELEHHIKIYKNAQVFNTTKGGAEISGTKFIPLEELISDVLTKKNVDQAWIDQQNKYNLNITLEKQKGLKKASKEFKKANTACFSELRLIHQAVESKQKKDMEKRFNQLDREFSKLRRNIFYTGFIEPMIRVEQRKLAENHLTYRFEKDSIKKAQAIIQTYGSFLEQCAVHYEFVLPYFNEMNERILEIYI